LVLQQTSGAQKHRSHDVEGNRLGSKNLNNFTVNSQEKRYEHIFISKINIVNWKNEY
jgi:hypothetical protein